MKFVNATEKKEKTCWQRKTSTHCILISSLHWNTQFSSYSLWLYKTLFRWIKLHDPCNTTHFRAWAKRALYFSDFNNRKNQRYDTNLAFICSIGVNCKQWNGLITNQSLCLAWIIEKIMIAFFSFQLCFRSKQFDPSLHGSTETAHPCAKTHPS